MSSRTYHTDGWPGRRAPADPHIGWTRDGYPYPKAWLWVYIAEDDMDDLWSSMSIPLSTGVNGERLSPAERLSRAWRDALKMAAELEASRDLLYDIEAGKLPDGCYFHQQRVWRCVASTEDGEAGTMEREREWRFADDQDAYRLMNVLPEASEGPSRIADLRFGKDGWVVRLREPTERWRESIEFIRKGVHDGKAFQPNTRSVVVG